MFSRPKAAGLVVKSGVLYRQSTFLKRWKRNSFYLYQYGVIRCFGRHDDLDPKFERHIRDSVVSIKSGEKCSLEVVPPENIPRECLIVIEFKDGDLILCADNQADAYEWIQGIEAVKNGMVPTNTTAAAASPMVPLTSQGMFGASMGYQGHVVQPVPQTIQYPAGGPMPQQIVIQQAPQQIIIDDYDRCRCRGRYGRHCNHNYGHTDLYF